MDVLPPSARDEGSEENLVGGGVHSPALGILRTLWVERRYLGKALFAGLAAGALVALLIPSRYQSTARLMPPDSQANASLGMLAALSAKSGSGMGSVASDLLGIRGSGALFTRILRSRTVEDRLVGRFHLHQAYAIRPQRHARAA